MKLSKQIASLEALQNGKIRILYEKGEVKIVGPRGKPLKFNFASGYAKVCVPDKNSPNSQIKVPVHILVVLDTRLKQSLSDDLMSITYPEGWEVNHIDHNKRNNTPHNLEVGPKHINQRSKPIFNLVLSGEQISALLTLCKHFPNLDRRALATSIGVSTQQVENVLKSLT